jgi:hypothetical protein
LEAHVDAPIDSEVEDDTPGKDKAADDDAEATENVEAIERLKSFLDGQDRTKATPQMLTALAMDPTPFCWGAIRLETLSAYINTLAVLSTDTVLSSGDVPLDASSPSFAQLEMGYFLSCGASDLCALLLEAISDNGRAVSYLARSL